jgi:hypothetical protein
MRRYYNRGPIKNREVILSTETRQILCGLAYLKVLIEQSSKSYAIIYIIILLKDKEWMRL